MEFRLAADYEPKGDQPKAIEAITESIRAGKPSQTLLGVTGSGKTFTMANVIQRLQRPALIISHNKTLAAQLYSEFKAFFPENAVEYFVSYYDYYQPEAYVPSTDTYIEKDSSVNEEIERLRLAATGSLISRRDVIVIASVSCIYGLGSPEDFKALSVELSKGQTLGRDEFLERLVEALYNRNDVELKPGLFRVRGDVVDLFPAYAKNPIRIEFWGDEVEELTEIDAVSGSGLNKLENYRVYPANQYVTTREKIGSACKAIEAELEERVSWFEKEDLLLEAQRIRMRTEYDLEMLREIGFCNGIENYSRHLSHRKPGQRPWCLIDFFPKDFLLFVDESHVTLPQLGGMYNGDRARKQKLVDFGFRLPSAMDNRPLQPEEFEKVTGQTVYVSATPAELRAIFDAYARSNANMSDELQEKRSMSIGEWLTLLGHFNLFGTGQVSYFGAKMVFKWCMIRARPDHSVESERKMRQLSFVDFLEAICRIASTMALPSDPELEAADAQDAGEPYSPLHPGSRHWPMGGQVYIEIRVEETVDAADHIRETPSLFGKRHKE